MDVASDDPSHAKRDTARLLAGPEITAVDSIGGPVWVAWREGTLTRAEELEALCEWVTAAKDAPAKGPQKNDQVLANAIRRHLRVTAKAKDQQAKESQKDDQVLANAIRRHLKAARQAARAEALESTSRFVLVRRIFRNGPLIERAMSNLDAAEAQLLNLAPAKYILG